MKRKQALLIAGILLLTALPFSVAGIGITFGVGYGYEALAVGIQAGLVVPITPITRDLRFAPHLLYWFGDSYDTWHWDFNLQYVLTSRSIIRLYVLAGLHWAHNGVSDNSEWGYNLGGGMEIGFNSFAFYFEGAWAIEGVDQFSMVMGGRWFF